MALQHRTPPAEVLSSWEEAAANLHSAHGELIALLRYAARNPLDCRPHPVFVLGVDAVAGDAGLRGAEPAGWWALAAGRAGHYALASQEHSPGGAHSFTGAHRGHFIDALCRLLAEPALQAQCGDRNYTPAVLRVHALSVFALWLRAPDEAGDEAGRLIAVPPAPGALQPWPMVYTAASFHQALRADATRMLTQR